MFDKNRLPMNNSCVLPLRVAMGDMSYSELAEKIGTTRQATRAMLRDPEKNLQFKTILKIADALGWHIELVKNE